MRYDNSADIAGDKSWLGWIRDRGAWILAGALILLGICLIHRFPDPGFPHALGEAVLIAGLLTCTVDPFLKWRMQKEVAEDVFRHLLGFDLPQEIRETLREFLESNRWYRRNVDIEASIKPAPSESNVELVVEIRAEVVAVATTEYQQHVSFEESEKGRILEASVISRTHEDRSYTEKNPSMKIHETEPMVMYWSGKQTPLKSSEKLETFVRFALIKSSSDFFTLNFGSSVIKPKLRLNACDGFVFTASISKPDQQNGNEYVYSKVFVAGDHIQIRWKPTESAGRKNDIK